MARSSIPPSRRPLATAFKVLLYGGLLALIALLVAVAVAVASLPGYSELTKRSDLGQMIRVRAADGSVLVSIGPSFGKWLHYDEIPPQMRTAMIAIEDRRFRSHIGVDPIGIARALKVKAATGHWAQGGSTITQQLARNIFLTNNRSFARKFKEAILALALERKFSKDQILELYLNQIYFGHGRYGVEEAARVYFGKAVKDVTLAEAALLAGIIKGPNLYSPRVDLGLGMQRRTYVLDQMLAKCFASPDQVEAAKKETVTLAPEAEVLAEHLRRLVPHRGREPGTERDHGYSTLSSSG